MYMIFGFCYKMWAIPTGTSLAFLFKKKSQYMVSHPELSSDPPIGSDRESGCDSDVEAELSSSFLLQISTTLPNASIFT